MNHIALCALAALCTATPALAQDQDQELWLTGGFGAKLGDQTKFEFDTVTRFGNDAGGLYEVEINTQVVQELGGGLNIAGGYVRNINYSRGNVTSTEDRLRAHVGYATTVGPVKLSGRVRLEVRFRSDGDDTGYRLRPQLKATLPLGKKSPFSLVASHESFIPLNDTDWRQRAGHERMRNFAGVNWKATKLIGIEAGYMNQYNFRPAPARDVMDHALSLSAILSF
ncbi:DUF2490 domain-containing protein [Sphingomonas sp. MG17]|uniref:DUF2490 domain-containing protein n=1 Tax=Sphingomonas tagetis TaxID=2949092 RepID=A0A9X2KKI6_9SPHN|nr:DUF2490 domain-containing protein [Sphingomonas tagetis]MCP3729657.1 DUF2490 domain-containing protein [Sphingomonas tagetis]